MTNRAAATRYARAVLDVAVKEADPEQLLKELQGFQSLIEATPALRQALLSPAVPAAKKRAVIEGLLHHQTGGVSLVIAKLLLMLAERDRFAIFADLVEAY